MATKMSMDDMDVSYVTANDLRKGSIVMLRGNFPCKVVDYAKAKTGKHGSAKIRVVGIEVRTGKKYDEIFQSTQQVCLPVVQKTDYGLVSISDDAVILQGPDGSTREDLRVSDEEMFAEIQDAFYADKEITVTVMSLLKTDTIAKFVTK